MKIQQIFPYKDSHKLKSKNSPITSVKLPFRLTSSSNATSERVQKEIKQKEFLHENLIRHHKHLDALVSSSRMPLYSTSACFPFDFFPDQLSIEIAQVNVMKKSFFFTQHIQSIPIKNVADVFLQTSVFFATLKIIDSSYIENSVKIEYLKKDDACKARQLIQGLVIAHKEGIEVTGIPPKELILKLEQLGTARDIDFIQ